jgi:predicted nucleic acid-binding protein
LGAGKEASAVVRIVSNTGPVIGLAKIGKVDLLKMLAEEVLIPPYVYKELFGKIGTEAAQIEMALSDFIRVAPVNVTEPSITSVLAELDEGERQAVALASALGKDVLLLMDDHAGRRAARKLGVAITGLAGLLLVAKEKRLVDNVGSLLEALRNAGYWLSDEVVEIARKLAGE